LIGPQVGTTQWWCEPFARIDKKQDKGVGAWEKIREMPIVLTSKPGENAQGTI